MTSPARKKFIVTFLLLIILATLILGGCCLFLFNIFGIQDAYYGSRYFRPYAILKQEPWFNQVVQMSNGEILLAGFEKSEIFNPYTKQSRLISGTKSVNAFGHFLNFLPLKNGNVIITQQDPITYGIGKILCWKDPSLAASRSELYCPQKRTLFFNNNKEDFEWILYEYNFLIGQSTNMLPDGNVLVIGGRIDSQYKRNELPFFFQNPGGAGKEVLIYSTKDYKFKRIGELKYPRYNHTTLVIDNSHALVIGGNKTTGILVNDGQLMNNIVKEVELVDFTTGESKLIKKLSSNTPMVNVVPIDKSKYLISWNVLKDGKAYSEILDINRPEQSDYIGTYLPTNPLDGLGPCTMIPNKRLICVSHREVVEINLNTKKCNRIDKLITPILSQVIVINDPKVGLLIFGTSKNLHSEIKIVQKFDYNKYLINNKISTSGDY